VAVVFEEGADIVFEIVEKRSGYGIVKQAYGVGGMESGATARKTA